MKSKGLFSRKSRTEKNRWLIPAEHVLLTLLLAVPVFFLLVIMDRRAGFDPLNYRPDNLFPPIPLYLADYSLCFASRLLIGSITKLFSYQLTLNQLYDICVTMNILALVIVSVIAGALVRRGIQQRSFLILFIAALFVLNPVVSQENYPAIGSYDTYWLVLFAVQLLLFGTKGFAVLAPILCFTGMLIHYGYFFSFIPCVIAFLFYDFLYSPKKGERILSGVSIGATGLSSAALLVWSFLNQNKHLKMTGPEFHAYLLSRLKLTGVEEIRLRRLFGDNLFPYNFFEIYFFNNRDGVEQTSMKPGRQLELFWGYLQETTGVGYYLKYAALLLPFFVLLAVFWCVCAKKARGAGKLPFIGFIGIVLMFFAACLFSTDLYRWGAAAMISQISLLLGMFRKQDATFLLVLELPLWRKKWFVAAALLLGAVYVAVMLHYGAHLPRTVDR